MSMKNRMMKINIISIFCLILTTCNIEPVENDSTVKNDTKENQNPISNDYIVENLSQIEGNVTPVIIEVKNGKSPGKVYNIRYNSSLTIPQVAGSYIITFDVEAAEGWNAATGLNIGTLNVINGNL